MLGMKIVERYVGLTVLTSIGVTLAVLVGISSLFKFIDQLSHIGKGEFNFITAALYTLYLIPEDIEIFFPMAAMIGGLVGLGSMAQNSELVVMQAIGMSKTNVVSAVLKSSISIILIMMVFSEWGVPQATRAAKELRTQAISAGKLYSGEQGVWAKDGAAFINIKEVAENGDLFGISVFDFDDEQKLKSQLTAEFGSFSQNGWQLTDVVIKHWQNRQITTSQFDTLPWPTTLTPDKLGVVLVKPEKMPLSELAEYLEYLKQNEQNSARYELAFWRKIFQPLNVAVMLLLALSFIFGPLRSVTMGARVILGILTGFSFFLFDRIFGSMSMVYEIPAAFGAFAPTLVFSIIAMRLLTKKQK
jgi:lipopolysaccharide export system permease protein